MEDNKLNFNRPFLSVRRNSPAVTSRKDDKGKTGNYVPVRTHLLSYRSELKSGPIRNPGAVPFQWEQTPGQPKEVSKQETRNHHRPPIVPKLPPGRCPQAIQQHSSQIIPDENSSQIVTVAGYYSQSGLHGDENFQNFERCDEITEKGMHSQSGDSDEDYVDAPDTLSRTESFFINCSVSGLSGFDDLDTERTESSFTDPKSLEFMMDRFLPAAKAMASETPQCASQKEYITRDHPQQSKRIVSSGKLLLRYGPSFAKRYSYCHETEQEEEEDSDDDYNQHKKFPGVCGLLPRLCSRSSLSVLNAVPTMRMRTRVPIHAANTTQNRASSAGSYGETENKSKPDYSELKSMDTIQTSELEVNETNSGNEHFQVDNHNASASCHAPFSFIEEQEVAGVPDETNHTRINAKTFQELLADQGSSEESDAGEPAVEKSLYVDTMKMVETETTASCSPPIEEDAKGVPVSEEVLKISANEVVMDVPEAFGENEDANLSSTMTKILKVLDKDPSKSQPPKALALENGTHPNHSRFPVPLSLPKSPSDSWLGRTLPYISMKKSYLHSYLGVATNPKNHDPDVPRGDITWETFVKSTKVRQHHSCHSKELLTPIPED